MTGAVIQLFACHARIVRARWRGDPRVGDPCQFPALWRHEWGEFRIDVCGYHQRAFLRESLTRLRP